MKKFLSFILCFAFIFALASCEIGGGGSNTPSEKEDEAWKSVVVPELKVSGQAVEIGEEAEEYEIASAETYNAQLGAFYATYLKAQEAESIAERYALMAVAEAKLYESGAFLPTTTQGGNFAISRVAPRTISSCLWGNDSDRLYSTIVVKGNPLKASEREELKAIWNVEASKGAGEYREKVKEYLAQKGYEIDSVYKMRYTSDPETFDILSSSKAVDAEVLVNTYDGLLEYDFENTQRPALATGYEVSEDGKVYTFHIREGVKWVDYQGREVAEVQADDWVAGLQHMTDADAGLDYLIDGIVKGYGAYVAGTDTDFSHVGVRAVDKYTLEIELEVECPYFVTMLGYSCFAPLSRAYYESQGGKFGAEFDASEETYQYASDFTKIAYCGPFTISAYTKENKIVFSKNEAYWNAEAVELEAIEWYYDDARDELKAYNDMVSGQIAGAGLNSAALVQAHQDGKDAYIYTADTNATAFCGFFNINREGYANFNDGSKGASPKSAKEKEEAQIALANVYFRLAIAFAFDRGTWNAISVGEELKYVSLTNGYTPGNFVKLPEAATVEINGKEVEFAAGTFYGEIVQAQLDADGIQIKYWDAESGSSAGFDGWYNPTNARAYLEKAIKELAGQVQISAANPIYIDYPCRAYNQLLSSQDIAFKMSVEQALGGLVKVNLVMFNSSTDYRACGYSTKYGYQANYDLYTGSGWGPDYGDPATYLDTMLPEYAGYMVKTLGIY